MKISKMSLVGAAAIVVTLGLSQPAAAQDGSSGVSFNARGGMNVPTFDIADIVDPGPSFGVGVAIQVSETLDLRGSADFGFHPGAETEEGTELADVNVYHYMAGLGFPLTGRDGGPWRVSVNAGAGAMTFDVDGGESNTYFAINVGGEVGYMASEQVELFLSPQGDIAFTDEDVLGTDNAWVWPFTAGVKINF